MPIVPMTGKPEDSLYPEQKIEINPLSYLNTPDTATEAQFAVAVDELAKMSPFGIRQTGDYSQFGADNAKDAFFNLRKATIHGIESLSDDESRTWFDTDPEDIETRYRIASENLPPSQLASLFVGEVVGGIDDMPILSEAEYKVAPPEVREASDRLKVQSGQATDVEAAWDRRPGRDKMRGDFPTITPGFASWDTPPPLPDDADFSGIISQWRDRYNKERTISAYDARIDAKNTLRKWAMMRPLLSDDADGLLQHIMADKPRDDEFDAKFMALPEDQQEVVMMLGRDLRNTPGQNLLRDSVREFLNGGKRLFVYAGREARDIWMLGETDREDFQKQAEIKARMEELWAPKRSQEYGYWEDAIIGTIGSLPYTGFTMATAMAGVPEVGLGVISLSMAHQFKQQIALQGGDVTDPKVLVLAQAAGIAYWGIEQAQVGTWMKSMTDLERRMATATFAKNIIPSIYKAEARAKVRQVAPKLASDFTGDLLKEWIYEEETQDLIEEGFVSWGIGEDVARNMAEQAVESLQQNFGTMLLMTGGFSGIGAARTGLSRKHTDQELYDAMHHRAQLVGSLHQRTELREKLRKGEEIDQREMKRLERDIDYQRRVLSTMHRAFNKAGGMEDAESAFQRMGLDPRQSFLAAYMFDQERRAIMGDTDLTQAEKEELLGKQATSLSLLRQAYPGRTFTENLDGTFTSSYTLNGSEVREIHQTGTIEWDPASPEGATSAVEAVNLAEKDAALQNDETFPANAKGMTVERWLNLTPEARNEIVKALKLHPEGNFIFTAKMAGSPDVAQVDENQVRRLSGEITLSPDAAPSATFHEDLHAFVRYLRETGELTPQDIQKLREEFGDPRQGVNEDFNEENAAETVRRMQSRSVRHVESTGAEAIMDKVFDVLDRIDLFRRKKKQAETVAENLLGQMRRGEWTGIPVGTITEAQRQKNAQLRENAKRKPRKQAKKPQEPAAKEPEQSQEPSGAEIQPEGQAGEKPPSQTPTAAHGEGQTAEEAAAAAEADEIGAGETAEVDADQPLGKGEWRAVTPHGNVEAEGEWEVRDLFDLITSWDAGYNITQFQGRDAGTGNKTAESLEKIDTVARNPDVNRMGESSYTSGASPMWSPRGEVIVRNHLTESLRKAVKSYPAQWAKVERWTRRMAADKGIVIPESIKFPVIGRRIDRILTPGATMKDVADLSNIQDQTPMGENERAWNDGAAIRDKNLLRFFRPSDTGNLNAPSNAEFITQFIRARNASDIIDKSTRMLTDSGSDRIKMALLGLILGESMEARNTINSLLTSEAKGVRTQVNGILKAVPVLVSVTQTHPAYDLSDILAVTLHEFITAKNNNESPFQDVLLPRPPAVDALLRALYTRTRSADIQDIFTEYAARVRKIDTETGKLMDIPDSTKEELLAAAIEATKPIIKPGEKADAEADAEAGEASDSPTPLTPNERAESRDFTAPVQPQGEMEANIESGTVPPPRSYDHDKKAPPTTGTGEPALPGMDEMRFWRETPTLPTTPGGEPRIVSSRLPYMLAGNKSHIYANHSQMFEALVRNAPTFVDAFGGAATYTYSLANAGALPKGSTWNEWEYTRYVTTDQIKRNPEEVIQALDDMGDRLQEVVPAGKRSDDEKDAARQQIIDWLNAELRGEHGIQYVPEQAEDAEGRVVLNNTPQTAALYLLIQNISYSSRAQDVGMVDGKPTWTVAGDDNKLHPTDGKLLTLIDAQGRWSPGMRLAEPAPFIRKASKLLNDRKINVTHRDGWSLAMDRDVTPEGAVVAIDTSYFGAQNYGLKTRDDGDMDVWLEKVRQYLLPRINDVTFIITNNWNFHAVNELIKMGFHVARTTRANDTPELIAMSGKARFAVPEAIRTVDYIGQPVQQDDTDADPGRFSVTAAALKRLNKEPYKDEAKQVLRDLRRIPASLKPYIERYSDPDDLISLAMFAGWKRGPKVATEHRATYRPAVRLKDGRIAWHPRARMHSEALSMWLEQQDIPFEAFDIDEYYGDGGLGPDGRYYEQPRIGDGPTDFEDMREQGRYSVKANRPIATAFYSQLRRTIEAKMPNKATVAQVRATLDPAKGSGVKQDEIFWSGLQEFLDSKEPTDMVTKEEVLAATREVVVTDVVKGDFHDYEVKELADKLFNDAVNEAYETWVDRNGDPFSVEYSAEERTDEDGEKYFAVVVDTGTRGEEKEEVDRFYNDAEAIDEAQRLNDKGQAEAEAESKRAIASDMDYKSFVEDARRELADDSGTKFESYVLPGGENYRELLLTLPPQGTEDKSGFGMWITQGAEAGQFVDNPDEGVRWVFPTSAEAQEMIDDMESGDSMEVRPIQQEREAGFRSGHFSELNIVAHVRFNERVSADGKRTLFIEEIQSDWAQKGKKEGFADKKRLDDLDKKLMSEGKLSEQEAAEYDRLTNLVHLSATHGGVPNAPYVTKTDAWVSLALKRMVRWAAENGFEQVAWTTGEQQAERYDLSKQVDEIRVDVADGNYVVEADRDGGRVINKVARGEAALEALIGKELAKKAVEQLKTEKVATFTGQDLKVGGEGMKAFYDQIVPNTANKLFKRFGAKASEAWFDLGDPEDAISPPPDDMVDEGGFTAHALPVTTSLRDSVLYEGQARFSVRAYPDLYSDVLSKHPTSAKLDGNKAWLTLDGKWINVDEHRDAVPFVDGIYADVGVQEMAEAGLVRVHWVDFSRMPGGVMYAEHAPGQLTQAQRKELEDTAIERGGEVEYDPGQAWIRQPPPRFSIRAHRPMFGSANRAIASLAVQHLMGEKLDTERAEKAAYLFAASGTTPDQMIADAKKLAESKVAQQAKKHIENRDPNAAHQVMSQQAEYDSIVALRTGMKSGLKMGQEAERAKQAAEKKLLLNARGEDLQQFIIDTGIDWTETLLSSLPEAFAEWEKARKDAEDKAKKEGAPEGPQQEPEAPPADPAELEARDRRMRELVAAVRAWGDAERAKREKEADDRRKKEQERIEKGESGEEADDVSDTDEGGEQAEGMEPEGLSIPKELLQAHGVDIRNAQEVAHLIRIWMADWLVRQSKGRLTHQTVWKDREAVEKYRKTMVAQLRDMANGMVEQGWSMTVIHNRISDIPSVAKPDTVERRTASIIAMIQAHSIRQTRAQLITDIRKNIKKKAIKGKRQDLLNEDLQSKINNEQEQTARYLRRILTWSPEKVDAEIVAIQARLKERTELYNEQNPDVKVAMDVEFHRDLMRLRVLQEWGGLKRLLPAQIKQAGIAIDGWLVSAQERLYRRWWAMEEQIAKLVDALHDAIVPDDPEQARIEVCKVSQWISDNVATVRQRLEGLIRQQHDPVKRQAAQAAIDEIMFILSRGTEVYRTVAHEYRQAFVDAVNEIAGGKSAATAYMKHLEEEIPIEVAEQVSSQGYNGRGGGRIMTYNQALQLYASITQRGYASNVKLHKREEHASLLESIFTTEDLALIARLREMYEERRGRLSEVVQEVSGMLVWRPDPLYMPVRVKMPKKGGFQSNGDPSTWMPLARSLTPRVHHGLDFDEGATLTGTFYDATEDAARAIGFGTRGLVLRGVLGNSAVQEAADRYYGGKEMADLNQQVVQALDGFGRTDQDTTHGMLRTVRELNAYAALSWNPLTALKQTVSFPVFAMALEGGFSHVMSAIKDFDRDALREIMESDGFKARYKGGFMPEVAEILADGRSNIIARFYKLGMTTVQIGDFVPSLLVTPGLYKARLAQNLADGMDEATAKERAMTWTWEMIEATQQTSRAEMLPKFYRQTGAGSEAMKLILQFSSAPLLQLAHEYHAARDWRAGVEGAGLRLGRAILVNHIIIPQMLEMVKKMFYWLIGRDEPEDANLFWSILNGATIGAVSRIMIAGILADVGYNALVHRKVKWGGQMVPAESLMRTTGYGMMAIGDLLRMPFDDEATMEQFQADLVRTLEGMLAPFRYGKEFYDNRIAQ